MSIGGMSVSPDGHKLAYSTDNTGFRQYTLHIRDLQTGADLPDTAERVGSLVWAADSHTLFYTTEDEVTKRQDHLFRHRLGDPVEEDAVVYEERDERFNLGVGKTRDGKYLLMEAGSHTTNECSYLPADTPGGVFLRNRPPRRRARVLRRSPGRPVLHPHQRHRKKLPRRHSPGEWRRPGGVD